MNSTKYDEYLAKSIQDQLNRTGITENAFLPRETGKENYKPRTLVDETLEYIDPTPNIYTLFVQFNQKFFWNVLLPVQVKWSPRMTSCAGICSFHPRSRECVISLSTPLLKLRPRKDLIETLLHEMIHAYLFLTNDNRDRDGHGPIFQSHMKRINKEAGTNITIYHTFHEEVRLYQQHWWRCNGPCQKRAPFFGTVRRAMNRAPGPNDFWWKDHQLSCGGQFIKIKEPEKPKNTKKENSKKRTSISSSATKTPEKNSILSWVNKTSSNNQNSNSNFLNQPGHQSTSSSKTKVNPSKNIQTDLKKLGNSTNNVHGWGTGGPNNTSCENSNFVTMKGAVTAPSTNKNPILSFSGILGGSGSGKSILLDKYSDKTSKTRKINSFNETSENKNSKFYDLTENDGLEIISKKYVNCPICNKSVEEPKINQHLDVCLNNSEEELHPNNKKRKISENDFSSNEKSNKVFKNSDKISSEGLNCPLCNKKQKLENFNEHLENCLKGDFEDEKDNASIVQNTSASSISLHDSPNVCLICEKVLKPNETLNDHLEDCVASVFNDSIEEDDHNTINLSKNKNKEDKEILESYPCPVCMTLVKESVMNEHLDACITKN